ncbi:MAG: hypothetical protein QM523_02780 [Candidatus Pacebacteria bacterium]|nr:hypothetical protein [Candidatus Paceibacterota bacterium]
MFQFVLATVELVSEVAVPAAAEPVHAAAEAKLPQLAFETFPMQLFWLALVIVFLYLVLSHYALPRLGRVLGNRSDQIEADLTAARGLHDQSEKIIGELDSRIAATQTAINEQLAKHHNELRAESAQKEALVMAELGGQAHESEKFILRGKEQAFQELRRQTPEIVAAAVERLMGEKPKLEDIDKQIALVMQHHSLSNHGAAN